MVYVSSGDEDHSCDGCGEPFEEGEKVELHKEGKTHKRCSKKFKMLKGLEKNKEEKSEPEECYEPWEETPPDYPYQTAKDKMIENWRESAKEIMGEDE